MRAAAFETILPHGPITVLPLNLTQTPSHSSPFLLLALALPAALGVLTPYWLIATHAAHDSSLLFERVETTLLLGCALLIWMFLFGWPIVRRAWQIGIHRTVTIARDAISVRDEGPFGQKSWRQPLGAYRGIAHHVRSSLSGTRHELLLIHPDPTRTLLLRAADKISQAEIDELTVLLGCREIAPQVFYRNTTERADWSYVAGKAKLASMDA